ncbi:hypothetical protein Sjap_010069 [Stephania japonica]|uniref:Uncharacterized protein n=1 Tax=Stephania japonica TaxID=461633 RepID=A0AAP0J8B9_9MAGN
MSTVNNTIPFAMMIVISFLFSLFSIFMATINDTIPMARARVEKAFNFSKLRKDVETVDEKGFSSLETALVTHNADEELNNESMEYSNKENENENEQLNNESMEYNNKENENAAASEDNSKELYYDEIYENIQAPMFFDFTCPEPPLLDEDRSWFCVSIGCDQQHEEIDHDALFESFRLRVLEARRPNLLLSKAQSIANSKANVPTIPKPFRLRTDATKAFGKTLKGSCTSAFHDMKYKKLMPTIPKPFRLRIDERAALREANLKKKHGIASLKEIGKSEKGM